MAARYAEDPQVEINFMGRGENLRSIQSQGITIQLEQEGKTIVAHPDKATDVPTEIGPVDYLFCCTKGYDLEANIRQLQPMIGPDTIIIPLLNGLGIPERIQALCPGRTIWGGCVYTGRNFI